HRDARAQAAAHSSASSFRSSTLHIIEAENVGHGIEAGLMTARPERRPERAARKNNAVLRPVHELQPLGGAGEDHAVVADHAAAAQRGETDTAGTAVAGIAGPPQHRTLRDIDAAAPGGGAISRSVRCWGGPAIPAPAVP